MVQDTMLLYPVLTLYRVLTSIVMHLDDELFMCMCASTNEILLRSVANRTNFV